MSNWISVDDGDRPPEMKTVIITDGVNVGVGYFSRFGDDAQWSADGYHCYLFDRTTITHWQPLPEPPL